jgi:hypothetical protein
MSPAEAMAAFSCTDFTDAVQWLQDKWNAPPVVCHYLAALRYEINVLPFRLFGWPEDGKPLPKLKDFLLKFEFGKEDPKAGDAEPDLEAGIEKLMRRLTDKKTRAKLPPKKLKRPPKPRKGKR